MTSRRQFISLLGGAAAAWPVAARGQQNGVRRIIVLLPATADDLQFQTWVGAFLQALALLGWTIGPNVRDRNPLGRSERRRHPQTCAGSGGPQRRMSF